MSVIITSNNQVKVDKINRLINKMIDKKFLVNDAANIAAQKAEMEKWHDSVFDSLESNVDKMM